METVVRQVSGMTCTGCEQRLGTVLRRVEGVRQVRADHTTGRVEVRIGPEQADHNVLDERIDNAGFDVVQGAAR